MRARRAGPRAARKPAKREARRSGALPVTGEALAADSPFPIVMLTPRGEVTYLNPAAVERFPGLRERGAGHHLVANVLAVAGAAPKGRRLIDREAMYGERVYAQRIVRAPALLTVHLCDVTEVHESREDLKILQTHDTLTELANRSQFLDQLAAAVHAAQRYKHPLTLALLDVDGMGRINATAGQKAGDEILAGIGRTLKTCLRREDFAGRFGGDEFAVSFAHSTAEEAVIGVDRIRRKVASLPLPAGAAGPVTLSCGLADLAPGDQGETNLLAAAVASLAQARAAAPARR